MNTTGLKSAFNYAKVRIRLRCSCAEYTTPWASDHSEELALPGLVENHRRYELCSGGHTHEAHYLATGEVRTVSV